MDVNKFINTQKMNARIRDEDISTLWDDSIISVTSEAGILLISMRVVNIPTVQSGDSTSMTLSYRYCLKCIQWHLSKYASYSIVYNSKN